MPQTFLPIDTRRQGQLRRRLLEALLFGLFRCGAAKILAACYDREPVITILMYHSVPRPRQAPWIDPVNAVPADVFKAQMRFLHRYRQVVSMDALVDALENGTSLPNNATVVTFDDGYQDNLHVAAPILARYAIPAVIYLPTAFIDTAHNQWNDILYGYFRTRTRHTLSLQGTMGTRQVRAWDLSRPAQRRQAYRQIAARLLVADADECKHLLATVRKQLAPMREQPRLTMNWDEVRALTRRYPNLKIGAHTVHHIDLTRHKDIARMEVEGSASRIESELGFRPRHFSFPYSASNPETQRWVRKLGFRSAVADAIEPVVRSCADRYCLPRIENCHDMRCFRIWTCYYPLLAKLMRKSSPSFAQFN
jgi:peptidoglycan/xylan/chitin deacetylase (PgdA/CDA1 family)